MASWALAAASLLVAGCASLMPGSGAAPTPEPRTALIQRTAYGVAHITAPDLRTLAFGVAYANAQDHVCQTADHVVTARGQRSLHFGAKMTSPFGLRNLPNEQIDMFVAATLDDALLEAAWAAVSPDARDMAQGYVEGYNHYLSTQASQLPAACRGKAWVRPMTLADYRRITELGAMQAGLVALADGVVAAQPPQASPASPAAQAAQAPGSATADRAAALTSAALPAPDLKEAVAAMREAGLVDSPLGSNAWAFGRDTTADGRGLLLGNPHFPWVGVNRFWQMHLTVPGQLDVMGAGIGQVPLVAIGFNRDVAWSHTVSTGKRFTLHELKLAPGDPTSYLVDGQARRMVARRVQGRTLWVSDFGPLIVIPRAGLNWTTTTAYALQDANRGNARSLDARLAINRARRVEDLDAANATLGNPWVNTIAADRHGQAYYADGSVVPDVDADLLKACLAGPRAQQLMQAAELVVLDGSRSACNWKRGTDSPVPGLIPTSRMPRAVRTDWVMNSNDSYVHTHPALRFEGISPLVGDAVVRRSRTLASLIEIPDVLARGKVSSEAVRTQIFSNRNHMAEWVLPELLAACPQAPSEAAREGCAALAGFQRVNDLNARGAHLFRQFWQLAHETPRLWRTPADPRKGVMRPQGLRLDDAAVAAAVWRALDTAVGQVKAAGFALDAPLGQVQRAAISTERVGVHGGEDREGVLNFVTARGSPPLNREGIAIDYGTSYIQVVGFDARGPVAHGLLTYGQSSNPASPHATDQLGLYASKQWPLMPFHAEDVRRAQVGPTLVLRRP